jgi:hypothetical protein
VARKAVHGFRSSSLLHESKLHESNLAPSTIPVRLEVLGASLDT